MAGVKIAGFLGVAPKVAPELLPATAGQIAHNCKLFSGDLIPYTQPQIVASTGRTGIVRTLFGLRDPDTDVIRWLSWPTDVDIAVAARTDRRDQRFYFSGDGRPKVSNYPLATGGIPPFPVTAYDLGLPVPPDSAQLVANAATFTPLVTASYSRDTSNIATLVTSTPHGLRAGTLVSVSGFSFMPGTYTQAGSSLGGTYSQATATLSMTINIANHGLQTGAIAHLTFSAHADINGAYSVSVISESQFAVTAPNAAARSGTATLANAGGSAITVTMAGHGLSDGSQVSLDFTSGTAADGVYTVSNVTANTFNITSTVHQVTGGNVRLDLRGFNAVNVEITRVNDTTFTYFSPGPAVTTTASTAGRVALGGLPQSRAYVFTWYTPWEEESIASKPSTTQFIREGIVVTIPNLPTAPPPGNTFTRGVRLYRTLASAAGTEYFRLATLWFPTALTAVQRTANVSRVTLLHPHNLGIGDRFQITGAAPDASFNITGGIVTAVINDRTFEYSQVGSNVGFTSASAGTLFHDVSEDPPTSTARYWGSGGNFAFVDDFDSRNLIDMLVSDNYDAPPEKLHGLIAIQNSVLCGFVDNTLYFSEPAKPHAWPKAYAVNVEHNIVGIAAIGGSVLVVTEGFPVLVSGSDPANGMGTARIDVHMPCLSKQSIVAMGYGVVYSTVDGLAVYSPSSGPATITRLLYNRDTWQQAVNPATVVAEFYGVNYFASHSAGAFVFEHDPQVGGFLTTVDCSFTASWYDRTTGTVYYVGGTNGNVMEWDSPTQPPMTQEWKSKVIATKGMINPGVARVVADFPPAGARWDASSAVFDGPEARWDAGVRVNLTFWAGKQQVLHTPVNSINGVRLPTGYRTDTFEIGVSSNIRIRALHLAETPIGLREV